MSEHKGLENVHMGGSSTEQEYAKAHGTPRSNVTRDDKGSTLGTAAMPKAPDPSPFVLGTK